MNDSLLKSSAAVVFFLAAAAMLSGCTTLRHGNVNSRPMDAEEVAAVTGASNSAHEPSITVSTQNQYGKRKSVQLPLEQGMTLQDALVETKVTRKFRDMDINVVRVTPYSKGQRVPLKAEYDPAKNRVGILHDMALHPGDHVMIVESDKSPLDEALSRFTGRR